MASLIGPARAQLVVVGAGHVEIHARGAVVSHLHAGDQRAVELLEHKSIEHVCGGVHLAHRAAEIGIDLGLHNARQRDRIGQRDPQGAVDQLEAGDLVFALVAADQAAIGELPATAGIERQLRQPDLARLCVEHGGLQDQRVGMVVTVKMHGSLLTLKLGGPGLRVLAKIERGIWPKRRWRIAAA